MHFSSEGMVDLFLQNPGDPQNYQHIKNKNEWKVPEFVFKKGQVNLGKGEHSRQPGAKHGE